MLVCLVSLVQLMAPLMVDQALALSATQSNATIHSGTNATTTSTIPTLTNIALQNGGVDNSLFAYCRVYGARYSYPTGQGGFNIDANQIKTSVQPIFLSSNDVALQETRGISHKVFSHFSYTWDRCDWMPFIGVGGSAEFGKNEKCNDSCETECSPCLSCIDCSLSQWSVWVKGGVSFN